jgi:hypothetical protein
MRHCRQLREGGGVPSKWWISRNVEDLNAPMNALSGPYENPRPGQPEMAIN